MRVNRLLLSIIGRTNPAIYDAVFPRGPTHRLSQVTLNPQPLPPLEMGAALAVEVIHATWFASRHGIEQGVVLEDVDDWCPTQPRKLKLPPWWPPVPEPEPHPEWLTAFHLGFAARLVLASAEHEGTRIGDAIDQLIGRSIASIDSLMDGLTHY